MIQRDNLTFKCATDLKPYRFVSITAATDTVAYTAVAVQPDAVTIAEGENGVVAVQLLSDTSRSFFIEVRGTVAIGDGLEVGLDGTAVVNDEGEIACVAKSAGVDGSLVTGYNI